GGRPAARGESGNRGESSRSPGGPGRSSRRAPSASSLRRRRSGGAGERVDVGSRPGHGKEPAEGASVGAHSLRPAAGRTPTPPGRIGEGEAGEGPHRGSVSGAPVGSALTQIPSGSRSHPGGVDSSPETSNVKRLLSTVGTFAPSGPSTA